MNAVVLVDKNWGIGRKGLQIPSFAEDRKQFKLLTSSSKGCIRGYARIVVMGRKTFEGDLGGKPLKDRVNLVLTTRKDYILNHKGIYAIKNPLDVFKIQKECEVGDDLVWCIGGEEVYKRYFDYFDKVFVTKINAVYDCDRHFPVNLDDENSGFRFSFGSDDDAWKVSEDTGILYQFRCYQRI